MKMKILIRKSGIFHIMYTSFKNFEHNQKNTTLHRFF